MPSSPHPLTIEDRMVASNGWRARRELWAQSLFLGAAYAALAMLGLLLWLPLDPARLLWIAASIERHQFAFAVLALSAGVAMTHARLAADARRLFVSSHAALPIWRDVQAVRDRRVRAQLILRASAGFALALLLLAVQDIDAAKACADALRWPLAAAFFAIAFAPGANARVQLAEGTARNPRAALLPRWLGWIERPVLPHLLQWWWQRSASLWLRGRAAIGLAFGLSLAPTEAAAILVPATLLMLLSMVNALDVAHRLGAEIEATLAQRPPSPRVLLQSIGPLHAVLSLAIAGFLALVLHLLRAPLVLVVLVVGGVLLLSAIDLCLALLLRREIRRLTLARTQVLAVLVVLASAMPLLLPVLAVALLVACRRRLRAESADA